ncbi:AsmA family protein [Microvirga flavescens]|uniref:AsmA family protein n=1 Tax=Microvirga flavescens TaxID=2249811 RepID=UPI000DDB0ACF|nr:AsmA family protein [Microvirga flavescens]
MSRRAVLTIALIALALLGAAAFPWTLSSDSLSAALTRHLERDYGLSFQVNGRSTFALLPTPRVKFEDVALKSADGRTQVQGGYLRGELRVLPLMFGQIELSEIALSDTRITAPFEQLRSLDWARGTEDRKGAERPVRAKRLILTGSSVQWSDFPSARLDRVNLVVSWHGGQEELAIAGSAAWRGEDIEIGEVSFTPALLAADAASPFTVKLKSLSGRVAVTGEAQLGADPRLSGKGTFDARSIRDFARWSGVSLPLSPLTGALSIAGEFSANKRRLSWPSVAVTLGDDRLDGTLSLRLDSDRPVIAGTLAADKLDLSDFFAPFIQTRTLSGAWNDDTLNLTRMTAGDLDIRLSATSAKLGFLTLGDMAASILVKPGQIEASLGRASFHDGSLKGRLSLNQVEGKPDLKGQAAFDRIDIAAFLSAVGEPRWITGQAGGQIQIEATGGTVSELVRSSHGRTSVSVKRGELIGIGLNDALKRIEKRPLAASLDWRGGRTAFDLAQVNLNIVSGTGEIVEGRLTAPEVHAALQGAVSLADRTLDVKALVDSATPNPNTSPLIVFDVDGGWDTVRITPDVKSLIQRSGAAKPLFGPERATQAAPTP